MKKSIWAIVLCSVALWTATAPADEAKCLSKRAGAAGKYQKCVQKWQSKCYGIGGCDQVMLSKCREKYAAVWPTLQALAGTSCGVGARLVDNGDGTVTDNLTGLVWEKKTTAVGSGTNSSDRHDVDNYYSWSAGPPYAENGTAYTDFLEDLNAGGGFAGANGWRLPTFAELQTIVLPEPYPCTTVPCIDATFGPTQSGTYWSATTDAGTPVGAWVVFFSDGHVSSFIKTNDLYGRAVRGGL